jgi:hypothetical protein
MATTNAEDEITIYYRKKFTKLIINLSNLWGALHFFC